MAVAILALSTNAVGQNLREVAREHARRHPNTPLHQAVPAGSYEKKSIEDLARESVVVVTGTLVTKGGRLGGASEDRVLTDYNISDVTVVTGRLAVPTGAVPGPTTPPIVTVWAGEVVAEGVRIRATSTDFDEIQNGGQYLLFLMPSRPPEIGRYEIYAGGIFQVAAQHAQPLLKRGIEVFGLKPDVTLPELISRIRSAGKAR